MPFPRISSFSAVLGVAALLSSSPAAFAAKVPAPVSGDIYAGFRAEGVSVSYLVKLGTDTVFRNAAAGTSFEVTGLGNIGADLIATFGAGWATRADLQWGIFGGRQSVNSTLYASRARVVAGTVADAWPALVQQARNATAGSIVDVSAGLGGYGDGDATANSPVATLQQNSEAFSSYFTQVGTQGTTDFGSLSSWTSIEGNFTVNSPASTLDLFRIAGTGVTHVGSFQISAAGVVTFTAVPLPTGDPDTDGDGFTDAEEAAAGSDPASAASSPQPAVSLAANGVRVQIPTGANRTYTVEYTEDPAAGWISVGTHQSGAGSAPLDFVDTDEARRAKGRGFYRVRVSS